MLFPSHTSLQGEWQGHFHIIWHKCCSTIKNKESKRTQTGFAPLHSDIFRLNNWGCHVLNFHVNSTFLKGQLVPTILMPGERSRELIVSTPLQSRDGSYGSLQPEGTAPLSGGVAGLAQVYRMLNGRGTQIAHRARLPFLETEWHIKNCQLLNQKHRTHMETNITWLPCSLDRNRGAQMEIMGLNRAHSHCTHTRDTWRKGSPYFSMGVGLCSWDHLLESRSVAFRTGKSSSFWGLARVSWREEARILHRI